MPRPKKAKADKPKKESTQQLIKTVRQRTWKLCSAEDKIRMALEGLRGDQTGATLFCQENIHTRS
jgi:hypothetical protein